MAPAAARSAFAESQRGVILAAAIEPAEAALDELRALAPRLDWDATVGLALRLGVGPLVHRTVKRAHLEVPDAARKRLLGAYAVNAIRNDAIMAEVLRVTKALDEAGIPSVPLKGAGLMATLYPDVGLRTLSDIDLLVPRSRAREAGRVLVGAGYAHCDSGLLLERSELFHHHVTFTRGARLGSFHLELHHRLITSFLSRDESEAVLSRSRPVAYGAGQVRRLAAEDEVLYCCSHLAVHVAEPHFKWLVDLAELLRRGSVDWDVVVARARATGAGTGLYEALRRLDLVCVAVPPGVLARVRPPLHVRLAFARLAPPAVALDDQRPGKWGQYALGVLLQEGLVDRILFAGYALGYKVWLERSRSVDDGGADGDDAAPGASGASA
ncbi:MAG: nucleotidyltransferase family protein [Deltaproteobacteria bacterium]|nr:nucleotidyltransferase family protein [Deltaproteobacteria bacterium]